MQFSIEVAINKDNKSHQAILRCLNGSEMLLLGLVISQCEMPLTDVLQKNEHAINKVKPQFVA